MSDVDDALFEFDSKGIDELVAADIVAPPGGSPVSVALDFQGFAHDSLELYPSRALVDDNFAGGTDIDYSGRNPQVLVWVASEYHIYWNPNRKARAAISRDAGATWRELPNLTKEMFGGNVAVSATDPNNIVWLPSYLLSPWEFLDLPRGLFVTNDGGGKWTTMKSVGGSSRFHRLMWWVGHQALASDKVEGGVFYLVDDTAKFLVSTDGGANWKSANPPPCREANACHVFGQLVPSPVKAGELWAGVGDDGLYRTRDRGATVCGKAPVLPRYGPWASVRHYTVLRCLRSTSTAPPTAMSGWACGARPTTAAPGV